MKYSESGSMDQLLCKKCYSSGDYDVQKSRTGWVALVEGLTRNVITVSNLDQYNVVQMLFKIFLS